MFTIVLLLMMMVLSTSGAAEQDKCTLINGVPIGGEKFGMSEYMGKPIRAAQTCVDACLAWKEERATMNGVVYDSQVEGCICVQKMKSILHKHGHVTACFIKEKAAELDKCTLRSGKAFGGQKDEITHEYMISAAQPCVDACLGLKNKDATINGIEYDEANEECYCVKNMKSVEPASHKSFACLIHSKKVDGEWGSWTEYSQCSKTCGGGSQKKTRECDKPKPAHGGKQCSGKKEETKSCNNNRCPTGYQVNCGRHKASSCSACSHRYRSRCQGDCKWCNGVCQVKRNYCPACPVNGKTTSGKCCVFPFYYYGRKYNRCIRSRTSRRYWCYTSYKSNDWGYCR